MNRTTEIFIIDSLEQIPALDIIRATPRHKAIKLIFGSFVEENRKVIGEDLKKHLAGFDVQIHLIEPIINIVRLISDEEIEMHQQFFERCAKDYRRLSTELIHKLAQKMAVTIDMEYPLNSFGAAYRDKQQRGKVEGWHYFFHGIHCAFKNQQTGQVIETCLIFPNEFGDLDPYFFTRYIMSTKEYHPLPVDIYEDCGDYGRIIEKMLSLGKFEKIPSAMNNHFGIVVKDRDKISLKTSTQLMKVKKIQIFLSVLSIVLSIFIAFLFIDPNAAFINESNGTTGTAFSDFITMFVFFEIAFMILIWGLPLLFNKRKDQQVKE